MDDHPVFLVDHDSDAREALSLLLRRVGYQVREFGSAAEFLMRLRPDDKGCVVMKPVDETALIEAVRSAMASLQAVGPARRPAVCDGVRLGQLTARETEVIDLIAEGLSTKEIARRLNLSPRTVEKHRAGIALKVGTASVAQLVRLVLGSPRAGLSRILE